MRDIRLKHIKIKPVRILAIGFLVAIIIGTILLSLPIASKTGNTTRLDDAFFTATSAVCVTGLTTLDTGKHFSIFGKFIIMFLIQIGGLGVMSFTMVYALIAKKKLSLSRRIVMKEALSFDKLSGIKKLVKHILIFTICCEILGAAFLMIKFIPVYGIKIGIFYSIFHSISAFCNAGFDLFGDSLVGFSSNSMVIFTMAFLIIAGGLGFSVWLDIFSYKKEKTLSVSTKLVLVVTFGLITAGMVIIFIFEHNNVLTLKNMTFHDKLMNSFFASVSPRSAGFNSIHFSRMTNATVLFSVIIMIIGGSPRSTAGGMKTTTFGVIVLTVISMLRGREDVEFMKKTISKEDVYKAFTVFFVAFTVIAIGTLVLSTTDGYHVIDGKKMAVENIVYEVASAFATGGLNLGVTKHLTVNGKMLLSFMMYMGRVGSLTLIFALMKKGEISEEIKYPEERIIIG